MFAMLDSPAILRLPRELRDQIWREALNQHQFLDLVLECQPFPCAPTSHVCHIKQTRPKCSKRHPAQSCGPAYSNLSLTFLRTCRQIYHEAVSLLYMKRQHSIHPDGRNSGLLLDPCWHEGTSPGCYSQNLSVDLSNSVCLSSENNIILRDIFSRIASFPRLRHLHLTTPRPKPTEKAIDTICLFLRKVKAVHRITLAIVNPDDSDMGECWERWPAGQLRSFVDTAWMRMVKPSAMLSNDQTVGMQDKFQYVLRTPSHRRSTMNDKTKVNVFESLEVDMGGKVDFEW